MNPTPDGYTDLKGILTIPDGHRVTIEIRFDTPDKQEATRRAIAAGIEVTE
jgi:hypothetical protein